MTVGVIGYTGWIGSYIYRDCLYRDYLYRDYLLDEHKTMGFHSSNIQSIQGQDFDLLFVCGVSAKKWLANKEPDQDLANIQSLVDALKTIGSVKKCVLISTIDVYSKDTDIKQNEDQIVPEQKEAYGRNRYWFEQQVINLFPNQTMICRLPALFGFELKKNIIFDFLFRKTCTLDLDSMFQWYDMSWFLNDLHSILAKNEYGTYNLFPEPLPNVELMSLLCQYTNSGRNVITTIGQKIIYNIQTIHRSSNYWRSKEASKNSLKRYLQTMLSTNLLVSNLAMHPLPLELLADFGAQATEIVPYKTFGSDFIDLPLDTFNEYKGKIYSMQGLFYPHNWTLRDNYNEILSYLLKLVNIAEYVECQILVFGSPQLRSIGSERFSKLLTTLNLKNVCICIEPNSAYYKNEFLKTCQETHDFVSQLHKNNIGWMMDLGNMQLENEDIVKCIELYAKEVKHVHFSTKDLKPLDTTLVAWIKYQLAKNGYNHKITLEILNCTIPELRNSLYQVQSPMNIDVIGAGWYGCHTTFDLMEKGYNITLYETKSNIFQGVSSHNQNRLHEGYHYPRSWNTRQLCKRNYDRFLTQYAFITQSLQNNLYFVAKDSLLDFETYRQIMQAEHLTFQEMDNTYLQNTAQKCFQVQERFIDFRLAQQFFESRLDSVLKLNTNYNSKHATSHLVIDCSYNSFQKIVDAHMEPSMFWIYTKNTDNLIAYTVMDGPFWSLYPYDINKNLYMVTHVKWGRFIENKRSEVEQDIETYYPCFLQHFTFVESCLTQKHIMISLCASREMQVHESQQWISVACGKITGIYDFQDYLHL